LKIIQYIAKNFGNFSSNYDIYNLPILDYYNSTYLQETTQDIIEMRNKYLKYKQKYIKLKSQLSSM
jgi:hypothetical protein